MGQTQDVSGWSPIMEAVEEGDLGRVKELIASGAEVNYATPLYEVTPLMTAVYHKKRGLVRILLEAGADPSALTRAGYSEYEDSPLLLAVKGGCPEIISMLISAGVDVNYRYSRGRTALLYSLSYGRPQVVKILLKSGADSKVLDDEGLGVKEWAAISGEKSGEMMDLVQEVLPAD